MSFEASLIRIQDQYLEFLQAQILKGFEDAKDSFDASDRQSFNGETDVVPTNEAIHQLQNEEKGDGYYLQLMRNEMTTHLSSLAEFLKVYWEKASLDSATYTEEEIQTQVSVLVAKSLEGAALKTFPQVPGAHSPSWIVLHRYLNSFDDPDPIRQRIWNYTGAHAATITALEVSSWVQFAAAALADYESDVKTFVSKIETK